MTYNSIELPISHWKIEYKAFLSFKARSEFAKLFSGKEKIVATEGEFIKKFEQELTIEQGIEMQKSIVEAIVYKVSDENGQEVSKEKLFDDIDASDIDFLISEIQKLPIFEKKST